MASRFGHFTHFINTLLLASLTRLGSSGSTSFYLLRFFFYLFLFLFFCSLFCFNANLCAFCFLSVYARIFRPDNTPARDKAAWSNVLPAGQIAFAMLCSALCSLLSARTWRLHGVAVLPATAPCAAWRSRCHSTLGIRANIYI